MSTLERPLTASLLLAASIALGGCAGSEDERPAPNATPPDPVVADAPATPGETPGPPMASQLFLGAAERGDAATLRKGIERGTDVNLADENGRTPLMMAAFDGHTEAVDLLLQAGATVDSRDAMGRTALMYASSGPNADTVQSLLAGGAQVNLVDGAEHFTALMFAAAEGQGTVVRLLLEKGADRALLDVDGDTAASFAARRGHVELAKLLGTSGGGE